MLKFNSIIIKPKKKKTLLTVNFNKSEAGKKGQVYDAQWTKRSNQPMSKKLEECIDRLTPHLLYASELADSSIKLNSEIDYELWFRDCHYQDDQRFDAIQITQIRFIGTEVLTAVKIFGYKETQLTDKPFKVKIESPVINLDKQPENRYPLASILDDQIEDLLIHIDNWLEKGETQIIMDFEHQEANQE